MTMSVFGAMLIDDLSVNNSCAVPAGVVWMRSLCTIWAPTRSGPVAPPGGVDSDSGLTAVAVPTCCAAAGAAAKNAAMSATVKRRDDRMANLSESQGRAGGDAEVAHREGRNVRYVGAVLREQPEIEQFPDRHFEAEPDAPFENVRRGKRIDDRIGRGVLPPADAGRRRQGPGPAVVERREIPRQPDVAGVAVVAERVEAGVGVRIGDARLKAQARINRPGRLQADGRQRAAHAAGQRIERQVAKALLHDLGIWVERNVADLDARGQPAAEAAVIRRVRQRRAGGDEIRLDRQPGRGAGGDAEARAGAQLQHADVELMRLELLRVVTERVGFERIAVLLLEIVDVVQAEGAEPIAIGPRRKLGVEQLARGQHRLRAGTQSGVGLVAQARLRIAAE